MEYIMRAKEGRGMDAKRMGFLVSFDIEQRAHGQRAVMYVLGNEVARDFATVEGACADLAERIRAQLARLSHA